jgi:hypothetical protein
VAAQIEHDRLEAGIGDRFGDAGSIQLKRELARKPCSMTIGRPSPSMR